MKQLLLAFPLAALLFAGLPVSHAFAQDSKTARGTVTNISSSSLTVKVGAQEMEFSVDNKTLVQARGGSTKTRQAVMSGKPGPGLGDVLRVGQAVAVNYQDMNGNLHAGLVRVVPSAGARGGSIAAPSERTSNGIVKAVTSDSITIGGSSGGGATFTQTFTIDSNTKIVGKGAGTLTAMRGGKAPLAELIANGDRVSVSYHRSGDTLRASDVRVTTKAAH